MVPVGTAMAFTELPLAVFPVPTGEEARSIVMAGPLWWLMAVLLMTGEAPSMATPLPYSMDR